MSLDIRIKENKTVVYDSNFYGFIGFSDSNRITLTNQILNENHVSDKRTFIEFIKNSVEFRKQQFYIDLIKSETSSVVVDIY